MTQHVDVLIVGAGLSGIGAACRLQERLPGKTYAVLEARDTIGGTWDLFRYPGIRSDSDMFTLGYPFRPHPDPLVPLVQRIRPVLRVHDLPGELSAAREVDDVPGLVRVITAAQVPW
jgi:cation diffusion facilitator CzcD-associated flavoprotein CzcO